MPTKINVEYTLIRECLTEYGFHHMHDFYNVCYQSIMKFNPKITQKGYYLYKHKVKLTAAETVEVIAYCMEAEGLPSIEKIRRLTADAEGYFKKPSGRQMEAYNWVLPKFDFQIALKAGREDLLAAYKRKNKIYREAGK